MFMHLGGDTLVRTKSIIAILNSENTMGASSTKEFLKNAGDKGMINELNPNPTSIVITDKKVFLSPISSLTLRKRAGFVAELETIV